MTTPTPGQPLSEADVSLLQPGDWLRHEDGTVHRILSAIEGWVFVADWREPIRHFTYLGRPDQDGWIAWSGGENPVPGVEVRARWKRLGDAPPVPSEVLNWTHPELVAYRPHAPVSRPGDGVESAADVLFLFREFVLRNATQWKMGAGHTHPMWRLIAETLGDQNDQQLNDGPRWAFIQPENLTPLKPPPAEPVSHPAGEGEGEREAVDWKDKAEGLEADLRSAVLVAWRRGAENWCRWNYPQWVEWLERCRPAAPDAGGGWMPIETAPKDGTEILIYRPGWQEAPRAKWGDHDGEDAEGKQIVFGGWFLASDWISHGCEDGFLGWSEDADVMPTHWAPLPALQPGGER